VKFVSWLETMRGNYVVEGIQCTYIIPANPKWLDYPIIFKGTSMISSLIRGIKRDEIIDLKDIRQSVIDIIDRLQWFYRSKSGFDNIRNSMITKDNHREVSASVWDGDDEMVNEFFLFGNHESEKKKDKAYVPPKGKPFPGTKAQYERSYEDFINNKRGKKLNPVEYLYELHYFGYDERLCTKIALANMVKMSEVFYGD
jgi:hypothetical protein